MVDTARTAESELVDVARLLANRSGVSWAYELLDELCRRRATGDLFLVLRMPERSTQVFAPGRRPVPAPDVASLMTRPSGVHLLHAASDGDRGIATATDEVIGLLGAAAFGAAATSTGAGGPTTGIASRTSIEAAVTRAAACGARYGWSSTAVLLATVGAQRASEARQALAGAVRNAMRTGDEVGDGGAGRVLVILGNAGADAARSFVARVRSALDVAGASHLELHTATATTPLETVDPAEIWRIALERLAASGARAAPGALELDAEELDAVELDIRLLPGVVSVGLETSAGSPSVWVVTTADGDDAREQTERRVAQSLPGAEVTVDVVRPAASCAPSAFGAMPSVPLRESAAEATDRAVTDGVGADGVGTDGVGTDGVGADGVAASHTAVSSARDIAMERRHVHVHQPLEPPTTRLLPTTTPGTSAVGRAKSEPRVSLVDARFDAAAGVSEVVLARGSARGRGSFPAGPLPGGAQATLAALGNLGLDVPFYVVSAGRTSSTPGEPVVVVLAARRGEQVAGAAERLGVAAGRDDVETASRATLSALNRFLSLQSDRS